MATTDRRTFGHWWDDHPTLKRFYVPMVLTATFVMTVVDVIGGKS